jgi:putative phosphoribosyl transferase
MLAAIGSLRQRHPRRVVVAIGVAPPDTLRRLELAADEVVCLETPEDSRAVGQFYDDFAPVSEADVAATLRHFREGRRRRHVTIREGFAEIEGDLAVPQGARGVVVFAHGSGSSRRSPRNRFVAETLNHRGFATLLLDLLTRDEDVDASSRFDIPLLTRRVVAAIRWIAERPDTGALPLGLFGASTGAACALRAAAAMPDVVRAVVSRGGRPDLAGGDLGDVRAPTLLIVGEDDHQVVALNRDAFERLAATDKRVDVVRGATHLFDERGALDRVAESAAEWFAEHLAAEPAAPSSGGAARA